MTDVSKQLQEILKEIESIQSSGETVDFNIARPSGYDD